MISVIHSQPYSENIKWKFPEVNSAYVLNNLFQYIAIIVLFCYCYC